MSTPIQHNFSTVSCSSKAVRWDPSEIASPAFTSSKPSYSYSMNPSPLPANDFDDSQYYSLNNWCILPRKTAFDTLTGYCKVEEHTSNKSWDIYGDLVYPNDEANPDGKGANDLPFTCLIKSYSIDPSSSLRGIWIQSKGGSIKNTNSSINLETWIRLLNPSDCTSDLPGNQPSQLTVHMGMRAKFDLFCDVVDVLTEKNDKYYNANSARTPAELHAALCTKRKNMRMEVEEPFDLELLKRESKFLMFNMKFVNAIAIEMRTGTSPLKTTAFWKGLNQCIKDYAADVKAGGATSGVWNNERYLESAVKSEVRRDCYLYGMRVNINDVKFINSKPFKTDEKGAGSDVRDVEVDSSSTQALRAPAPSTKALKVKVPGTAQSKSEKTSPRSSKAQIKESSPRKTSKSSKESEFKTEDVVNKIKAEAKPSIPPPNATTAAKSVVGEEEVKTAHLGNYAEPKSSSTSTSSAASSASSTTTPAPSQSKPAAATPEQTLLSSLKQLYHLPGQDYFSDVKLRLFITRLSKSRDFTAPPAFFIESVYGGEERAVMVKSIFNHERGSAALVMFGDSVRVLCEEDLQCGVEGRVVIAIGLLSKVVSMIRNVPFKSRKMMLSIETKFAINFTSSIDNIRSSVPVTTSAAGVEAGKELEEQIILTLGYLGSLTDKTDVGGGGGGGGGAEFVAVEAVQPKEDEAKEETAVTVTKTTTTSTTATTAPTTSTKPGTAAPEFKAVGKSAKIINAPASANAAAIKPARPRSDSETSVTKGASSSTSTSTASNSTATAATASTFPATAAAADNRPDWMKKKQKDKVEKKKKEREDSAKALAAIEEQKVLQDKLEREKEDKRKEEEIKRGVEKELKDQSLKDLQAVLDGGNSNSKSKSSSKNNKDTDDSSNDDEGEHEMDGEENKYESQKRGQSDSDDDDDDDDDDMSTNTNPYPNPEKEVKPMSSPSIPKKKSKQPSKTLVNPKNIPTTQPTSLSSQNLARLPPQNSGVRFNTNAGSYNNNNNKQSAAATTATDAAAATPQQQASEENEHEYDPDVFDIDNMLGDVIKNVSENQPTKSGNYQMQQRTEQQEQQEILQMQQQHAQELKVLQQKQQQRQQNQQQNQNQHQNQSQNQNQRNKHKNQQSNDQNNNGRKNSAPGFGQRTNAYSSSAGRGRGVSNQPAWQTNPSLLSSETGTGNASASLNQNQVRGQFSDGVNRSSSNSNQSSTRLVPPGPPPLPGSGGGGGRGGGGVESKRMGEPLQQEQEKKNKMEKEEGGMNDDDGGEGGQQGSFENDTVME